MSESKLVNAARVNNKTTHNGMTTNHTSLDACIDMLTKFGILELVRTGKVLITRGDHKT